MGELKPVPTEEFNIIAGRLGFDLETTIKDYYLTLLLFHLSKISGIYFKGGTALNKMLLNHARLSEDLDFTVKGSVKEKEKTIRRIISNARGFTKVEHDKRVHQFVRLIAHYANNGINGSIIIDLNGRSKLILKPQSLELKHFYPEYIPPFRVNALNIKEMIAEKVCAAADRYAPRDYFDLYNIIKLSLPVSISLVKRKFRENNERFDAKHIFKNTNRIFNKWEEDLLPLTSAKIPFSEVISIISRFFDYRKITKKKKLKKR
ncbi:MAG: nucleotidyl transferase AbiEii/AbiGii toxin family protein [Nanoarchaeota archaeon]|nr:nucleotidyl transferase AbiEii/AbiGii toxin family protein [Nanoarchaeota archaeon]